jgi:tetratricopeptide (TPR) repeat protein
MPGLVTLAPFAVLALLYLALRMTLADRELVVTRRLLDARDLRAATAEYEIYWFWRLPGANADIWYSRTWLAIARNATNPDVRAQAMAIAVEAAARATENAEEPGPAFYNLAQVSIEQQDYDEARHALRLAIASHPNWYLPRRALAQELLRQSRRDEERQQLR